MSITRLLSQARPLGAQAMITTPLLPVVTSTPVNPKGKGKATKDDPESNPDNNNLEDELGNKKIRDINVRIPDINISSYILRSAKIAILLKFNNKPKKLREFLAKLKININYNIGSFLTKTNKVLYIMLYLDGDAFEFI